MSLATEETVTQTNWRGADGAAYTSQRWAEINSIAYVTGFVHDLGDLGRFLQQLTTHCDTRQWLLEQLGVGPMMPSSYSYEFLAEEVLESLQFRDRAIVTQIAEKLKKQLAPYLIHGWGPEDSVAEVEKVDMRDAMHKAYMSMASKPNKSMYDSLAIELEAQGYQLIKK